MSSQVVTILGDIHDEWGMGVQKAETMSLLLKSVKVSAEIPLLFSIIN